MKDRLGNQREGRGWMGADKNFSKEIPPKSKNHNQGFPHELAKVM
jgi:hypothetical protein